MRERTVLDYKEWNKSLVLHFFGAAKDSPTYWQPVRHLAVTDEGLLRAAGNRHASAEDARRDLIRVFRNELRGKAFESEYRPSKQQIQPFEVPDNVVPLIITCIVAAEYTTEDNYRDAFDDICDNGRQNDTNTLPGLWEELRGWLWACRKRGGVDYSVRELFLPARPAAGWRNIFYSLALTFPNRRDRELLREQLRSLATSDVDPGLSEVIAAIDAVKKRFTPSFLSFFDDLRHQHPFRIDHPFWHAVQSAWREVVGLPEEEDRSIRFCAWVVRDEAHPCVLVRTTEVAERFGRSVTEVPHVDEVWRFVVTGPGGEPEMFVSDVLAGNVAVPDMGRDVRRGVVALEARSGGFHEWAGGIPRAGNGIAFVKADDRALDTFRRAIESHGGAFADPQSTQFEGWLFVNDVCFGPDRGDAAQLSVVSAPPVLQVVDGTGVRAAGSLLGRAVFLPRIHAPLAHRVMATASDRSQGELVLQRDEHSWVFPPSDLRGRWIIRAEGTDREPLGRLQLDFSAAPGHSEFQEPTGAQCDRLLVEGTNRDVRAVMMTLPCFPPDGPQRPFPGDGLVYLGPAVGAFHTEPAPGFDWVADLRRKTLSFVGDPSAPTPPSETVLDKSAARMWRKCFTQYEAASLPEEVRPTYVAYRGLVGSRAVVRRSTEEQLPRPKLLHPESASVEVPERGVEDLTVGLAAAASARHGLDEAELFNLVQCAFGELDWSVKWDIVRSWVEGGVLEQTMDARWPVRRYFVRRPRLVFTDATKREAVVAGLVVPEVVARIRTLAPATGLFTERRSLSPWGPPLFSVPNPEQLESALQRQEGFEASEIVPRLEDVTTPVDAIVLDAPRAVEDSEYAAADSRTWSPELGRFISREVHPGGIAVRLVQRPRQPARYEVTRDGSVVWWTHSRTWAFLAAANQRRENPFVLHGGLVVVPARRAERLPLALARALTFRGASSGPRRDGDYAYWFRSRATALAILGRLLPDVPFPTE